MKYWYEIFALHIYKEVHSLMVFSQKSLYLRKIIYVGFAHTVQFNDTFLQPT